MKGVPDGEMRASFRFLFEVKTVVGALRGAPARKQLERHLSHLTNDPYRTQFVIALTPDAGTPRLITHMRDPRLVWTSFEAVAQAITDLLTDPTEPAGEQQRLLLRELLALFNLDGLIAGDDVAVVAARAAYPLWQQYGAYVCQANRTFRNVKCWGFYRNKRIEPEFPKVLAHRPEVTFETTAARRWKNEGDPVNRRVGEVIEAMLADLVQESAAVRSVYVLQRYNDPSLTRRERALPHTATSAWTQNQRYASLKELLHASTTNNL